MYRSNPRYAEVEEAASAFYENQIEIQKEIESILLTNGVDCKDLVAYALDVYN